MEKKADIGLIGLAVMVTIGCWENTKRLPEGIDEGWTLMVVLNTAALPETRPPYVLVGADA